MTVAAQNPVTIVMERLLSRRAGETHVDTGFELRWRKRLTQEIGGAKLKALTDAALVPLCGQDHDRNAAGPIVRLQPAEHLQPVRRRHRQVEQYQVGCL